ncbi:MAG: hypothetical protein AAGJ40_09430 [Planctomycetota bacterium]
MKDWKELADKGPSIADDVPKHRRKRRRKLLGIERRYVGQDSFSGGFGADLLNKLREWHLLGRYETEADRKKALSSLTRKSQQFEYRIASESGTE